MTNAFRSGRLRNWGRRRTYDRLSEVAFAAEMQVDLALIARAERLIERLERSQRRKEFSA